ncbi:MULTISPECIES: DUF3618 domain-containing protein [Pseudofrankia]|uniref:DUF3618 domain-containing protein n=1 Tax=Pseudofrankia TaxID=2994363 RepID=UPI000234D382|nr:MULTISPECIES: DUF3618 domain-containing protein [Pseudofrankia]OHV35645.1 hypothetical protein BCD49_21915 [Pseudofrankia sp. EUN1h]
MGERPEEIRSEIEETRDRISAEIDELTDRYSPGRVAGRKVHDARDAAASMRARAGVGAGGIRQRLTLRGSGHLGEGHTGNGEAGAAGARLADADSRGKREPREARRHREADEAKHRGRFFRRHQGADKPERRRAASDGWTTATTTGAPDFEPYPAGPAGDVGHVGHVGYPADQPEHSSRSERSSYAYAGEGLYSSASPERTLHTGETSGATSRPVRSATAGARAGAHGTGEIAGPGEPGPAGMSEPASTARSRPSGQDTATGREPASRRRTKAGRGTTHKIHKINTGGHGQEIGLAGASVVMAAVGARLVRHAGRQETELRVAADSTRRYWRPDLPPAAAARAVSRKTSESRTRRPS